MNKSIIATEPTVIKRDQPNAWKKSVFSIPETKFVNRENVSAVGIAKGLSLIYSLPLNEFITTKKIGVKDHHQDAHDSKY